MGTAYISNEVLVDAKQLFKTNQDTKELISDIEIQERKNKIMERAIRANDTCSFMVNNGIELYLYDIKNENITTINELCVSSSSGDSDIWKFGYINNNNEIICLFGNNFVANNRDKAKLIFKRVEDYCVGKGKPFCYRK